MKGDCEYGKQNIKSCIIQEIYKEKKAWKVFNEFNKINRTAIKLIMNK